MSKKVSGWPLIAPRELPEGLPAYTDADADKMLVVGATETDVVPQQTVAGSELGGAEIEGLDEELFVPGAAVKVTMDGVTYPIVTVTEETQTTPQGDVTYYEAMFFEDEGLAIVYYPDDEAAGLTISTGTHTIEAVVMDVTGPTWVNHPVEPEYVIPEITEQDMGKVLTAGEGEPVWAEAGGGTITVVRTNITQSIGEGFTKIQYICDKYTNTTVFNAITGKKLVNVAIFPRFHTTNDNFGLPVLAGIFQRHHNQSGFAKSYGALTDGIVDTSSFTLDFVIYRPDNGTASSYTIDIEFYVQDV